MRLARFSIVAHLPSPLNHAKEPTMDKPGEDEALAKVLSHQGDADLAEWEDCVIVAGALMVAGYGPIADLAAENARLREALERCRHVFTDLYPGKWSAPRWNIPEGVAIVDAALSGTSLPEPSGDAAS